jgi:hypothetical protein
LAQSAKSCRNLVNGGFWLDGAHQGDHHSARSVAALVEIRQVIQLDRPDGFRPTILRAGVRVPFIDDLVECDRGHLARVLGALGQAGQELRPQTLDLFGREDRMAKNVCQQVEHQRHIFDQ